MGNAENGEGAPAEASAGQSGPGTTSLRDFVLANSPLLGAVGAFTALATFVSSNVLGLPWLATSLRFLLVIAAALLGLELVAQLPPECRLYRARIFPGQPWRLAAFAFAGQLAMLGALLNIYWQYPRLLAPTLALVIGLILWRVMPPRATTRTGMPILVAAVALLIAGLVFILLSQERTPIGGLMDYFRLEN